MSRTRPKLVIFGDPEKGSVSRAIARFTRSVEGRAMVLSHCSVGDCTGDLLRACDFAVVFGGDGTIISAAKNLSKARVPVIGVNLGKLGYLAEFSVREVIEQFDRIVAGGTSIERRMMLVCDVSCPDPGREGRTRFKAVAVNDVFVTAGPPFRLIELDILVDGESVASCVSDGLIIATPTGSTAYNLSAGGPILSGAMKAMVVTPICPHSLSFRSIVIHGQSKVEIQGLRLNEGSTVSIDGQISCALSAGERVRIRKADRDFLVVNNPLRSSWDTLATKLRWAEPPRYTGPTGPSQGA